MDLINVFNQLKTIMYPYENLLVCTSDLPGDYHLETNYIMKNKKPLYFGGVKINKNYVSYHLMPLYLQPDLLENISLALSRRMQGKSCFNFKTTNDELFDELKELTLAGFQYYKKEEYLS